ncbi:MAG: RNA polymerase sigma factor [Planctomycetota bacterium]
MAKGRDDEELVKRCIRREPGAWVEFVDRFQGTVLALARRYLKLNGHLPDEPELEDIVQEVFLAVIRRDFRLLRNYDATFTVKTYLGVITRTEVHRLLRRRRPMVGTDEELERAGPSVPSSSDGAADAEEKEVLLRALDALPQRDAEILKLRFLREMDYRAIASAMNIPETSVGQTLFRAKQRLVERLRGLLGILV